MSFFESMRVSATGLTAQSMRMDVISENIANVDTIRTEDGGPYKQKSVIFSEEGSREPFDSIFKNSYVRNLTGDGNVGQGVEVTEIAVDNSQGVLVYDPTNPYANEDGYIEKSNVNIVEQMVNMISASRSYESNVTAMNTTKTMITKTLEIGK